MYLVLVRPGDLLEGRFEIEKQAGSGGMGKVFRAWDRAVDRAVAVKALLGDRASDERRFAREAEVLANLSHPGIVQYVAHGVAPSGELYLAMEWLDGEDLSARLAHGPLGIDETIALGLHVAEALTTAPHEELRPMPTVQASIEIDTSADKLFALAQDYGLRLEWDPFLREMRFQDGATEAAVGVRVWVRANNGLSMEVRYITLKPPEQVAMTMIDGPPFFRQFSGAWLFKALSPGRTRVTFRYHFATRPRLLSPILDPMIGKVLTRDMEKRLAGLKTSAETTRILERLPVASAPWDCHHLAACTSMSRPCEG